MRSIIPIIILIFILCSIGWTAWRFWQILPFPHWGKWLAVGVYLFSFLVIFPHFIWGNRMPLWMAAASYELGTSWMIFFVYALLIFLALTLGRLLHLVPAEFLKNSIAGSCTVLGAVLLILLYGNLHYHHKYREELQLDAGEKLEKPVKIVLASDLHVGYHNRKAELARWVEMINAEKPDLVLFAGDIIDGSMRPVNEWNYAEEFRKLKAPVFACLGNHEYISGKNGSEAFYKEAGITLLRDSSAFCCGLRIIGRDDRSNPGRKPLEDLIAVGCQPGADAAVDCCAGADAAGDCCAGVDVAGDCCTGVDAAGNGMEPFCILLDHQPQDLSEAEEAGVDFQFSGHTHHGQIWPGNWLTKAMYEKDYGRYQRGNTNYYISSGLGLWGGKFRIGTRSEYVVLTLISQFE